jgi:hypothetical protein
LVEKKNYLNFQTVNLWPSYFQVVVHPILVGPDVPADERQHNLLWQLPENILVLLFSWRWLQSRFPRCSAIPGSMEHNNPWPSWAIEGKRL